MYDFVRKGGRVVALRQEVTIWAMRGEQILGDILPFKRKDVKAKAKGRTLCNSGAHKWEVYQEQNFDVKPGKLVTVYRCQRCGKKKIKAI